MTLLSERLENWKHQLYHEPNEAVAKDVLKEYFNFFGLEKTINELWLLTASALTNNEIFQEQSVRERHNILFFFEFTKMALESSYLLQKPEK